MKDCGGGGGGGDDDVGGGGGEVALISMSTHIEVQRT